jgi:hypothetical protein
LSTGEGEFGSVYKGSYMTEHGVLREVAVKALSKEAVEPGQVIIKCTEEATKSILSAEKWLPQSSKQRSSRA